MDVLLLRSTKLRYYGGYMEARGFSSAKVLTGTGITQEQFSDPAFLVNRQQWRVVVSNMIRLTGNAGLGFEVGRAAQLIDFGIVAHAMMSSRTLRQAIDFWVRFSNLVGMTIKLSIEDGGDSWVIRYDTLDLEGPYQWFSIEEILMSGIKMGEALAGKAFELQECKLAYRAPSHESLYRKYLTCPITFGASVTSIRIRNPLLDSPLRGNDPEFNEICLRHCGQILRQIANNSSVVARLHSLFIGHPRSLPSLEEAASQVGMSTRSLRRYLLEAGTSYQKLVDEFRFDLAKEYLNAEHLTQKEVAYLLGFGSASAFRRAFKLWSGTTVSQFVEATADTTLQNGTRLVVEAK